MSWFTGKKIAVFGASGAIGGKVCELLLSRQEVGDLVCFTHTSEQRSLFEKKNAIFGVTTSMWDAASRRSADAALNLCADADAIIVAAGHCPPDGFEEAIARPISKMDSPWFFNKQWEIHAVGRLNLLTSLIPALHNGARIVFVSSAITRLTQNGELPPPFLHAGDYAAAIAAGDEIVRYARIDPTVLANNIKLDLVKLGAVDTPFHRSSKHKPPATMSLDEAAVAIVIVLERGEAGKDHWILPK